MLPVDKLEMLARRYGELDSLLCDPQVLSDRNKLQKLTNERTELEASLQLLLLPPDPTDRKNAILEIRSGEGGEEAALFAADLFRMYARYAETQGWRIEILTSSESTTGGYKEVIALVAGKDVYSQL